MPWVGLNIFFHLEHTNKEKKKQGRRGIIQGASPQAACLMCWQSALVQGDASLSREESRDGVCLQLASRTVLRGDGREEQGPPGRKRCGREPLHTFNTVVLNKRERRTKAVIISRALPTLARERECVWYTHRVLLLHSFPWRLSRDPGQLPVRCSRALLPVPHTAAPTCWPSLRIHPAVTARAAATSLSSVPAEGGLMWVTERKVYRERES